MESGRHHFYGVRRGRVPGIYMNWEDCKQHVNGFRDCEFKGFPNVDDAVSWLRAGGVLLEPPPPPPSAPPSPPPPPPSPPRLGLVGSSTIVGGSSLSTQLHAMKVRSGQRTRLEAGCRRSRNDSTPKGKALTGDTWGADFVITEDMEVYLIRVCSQLRLDYPVFTRRESYTQNGAQLHGFWVVLQSAQHGVNWVVDGLFSEDEAEARQDATFQMLEKVLTMTGREICDYNFRKVAALQRRVEDLERQVSTPPYHQIRELQNENQMMRNELEMFHKMFDD
ncbi:Ribonuclease HI [Arachis hypogaea]|nr:Ribonuclease HI [Arachis hypogaea]